MGGRGNLTPTHNGEIMEKDFIRFGDYSFDSINKKLIEIESQINSLLVKINALNIAQVIHENKLKELNKKIGDK